MILVPKVFTFVGYQPTGIKPLLWLFPVTLTSNTARQLLSALAIYSVFSSADKAKPLVVEPVSLVGYKVVERVSITLSVAVLITETELSLAFATNKSVPFL